MERKINGFVIVTVVVLFAYVAATAIPQQEATAERLATVGKPSTVHALVRDGYPHVSPPTVWTSAQASMDHQPTVNEGAPVGDTTVTHAHREMNPSPKIQKKVQKRDVFDNVFQFVGEAYTGTVNTVNKVYDTVKTVVYDTPIALIGNATQIVNGGR